MDTLTGKYARSPLGPGYIKSPSPAARVKDVDAKEGIVSFYASSFDTIDSDGDYITKGAFTKTISEWGPKGRDRIAHLFDHNPTHRVGRPIEIVEDDFGLLFRSKLSQTAKGRDALIEYEEGVIREHSIAFDVIGHRIDEDRGAIALTELRLYEGSGVTWGANMNTPTIDLKALQDDPLLLDYMILQMKSFKRTLSRPITDSRAKEIEASLQSFETVISEVKTALQASRSSETGTQGESLSEVEIMQGLLARMNLTSIKRHAGKTDPGGRQGARIAA